MGTVLGRRLRTLLSMLRGDSVELSNSSDDSSWPDGDEAVCGELVSRMHDCWKSIRDGLPHGAAVDEPRMRRDAVARHFEEWLQARTEHLQLLDAWRRMEPRTRSTLLEFLADDPGLYNLVGLTCERCGAFSAQAFHPKHQVCTHCGWVWIRPPDPWKPRTRGIFRLDAVQRLGTNCNVGETLQLVRQPADTGAVQICRLDGTPLGHLSSEIAEFIADEMDAGAEYAVETAWVDESERAEARKVGLILTRIKERDA